MKCIIPILFYLRFQSIRAAGSGILNFVNFTTPWGTDQNNNCCPGGRQTRCPDQCDVHLNICIGELSSDRNCLYGQGTMFFHMDETTETVILGEVQRSIPNPFVYQFDFWKGMSVDIDVFVGESILVDTITFSLHDNPEHNGQVHDVGSQLYSGNKTRLVVAHSVACDPFHFGDCSIFCVPDPAMYTCDDDGNKQCLPDIDCRFEVSNDQVTLPSTDLIEVTDSHTSPSSDIPGSSVDSSYLNKHSSTSSGPPTVSEGYTVSFVESSTFYNVLFKESSTTRSDISEKTSRSFDVSENTLPPDRSSNSSTPIDGATPQQYSDSTTNYVSNSAPPAVDTSDSGEMTIGFETTAGGETKEEMSTNFGDVFTETLDKVTDTTRVDNPVSTTSPSAADSTTLTVPHICTGHVGISGENVGMLESTVSQHATDNRVDIASYSSSPHPEPSVNTIPEHDFSSFKTIGLSLALSNGATTESSKSHTDFNVDSQSSTTKDQYYPSDVTPDPDVTHTSDPTDSAPSLNTMNYDASVTTTTRDIEPSFKVSTLQTSDTYSGTSLTSGSVSEQTTTDVLSGEMGSMSSVAESGILSTLHPNTETHSRISSVTESVVVTSTEPTATGVTSTSQSVTSTEPIATGVASTLQSVTFTEPTATGVTSTSQSVTSTKSIATGVASTLQSVTSTEPTVTGVTSTLQSITSTEPTATGVASTLQSVTSTEPTVTGVASTLQSVTSTEPTATGMASTLQSVTSTEPTVTGVASTLQSVTSTESAANGVASTLQSVTSTEPTVIGAVSISQSVVSSTTGTSHKVEAATSEQFISSVESSSSNSEFISTKQSTLFYSGVTIEKEVTSTERSDITKYDITSTKQSYPLTTESSSSNSQLTTSEIKTSTTEKSSSNSKFISSIQSVVSTTESNPFNPEESTTTEKHYLPSSTTVINATEGPLQTGEYINASVESYLSTRNTLGPLPTESISITKETTPYQMSSTNSPSIIHTLKQNETVLTSTAGKPNIATSKTDDMQSPSTHPVDTTETSVTINHSSVMYKSTSSITETNKVTKVVPVSTESTGGKDTTTTSKTVQETDPSGWKTDFSGKTSSFTRIPTTTHLMSSEASTTPWSSSCTAAVVYPIGGKPLLSVRLAGGKQSVSVVTIEKEVAELLANAGYKVNSNEVKAIQTHFGGMTIVNITFDGTDLGLSSTSLAEVGDKLCKETSMFLLQPFFPVRTQDTDDDSGVIAGIVILVAYLTTLFIIATILVRRKYRERNRVSSRPMSEVSKVTRTAEQLLDRPETRMTALSSEYEESNC